MSAKKVIARLIGGPILLIGVIMISPIILIYLLLETIKWAMLNTFGDYEWGDD